MRYGHDTVDQVRSIMRPGNPVRSDVPAGSWYDSRGQETHDHIVALARNEGADAPAPPWSVRLRPGSVRPGSLRPLSGRARRVIAPVAAGLAVIGLVTGLTLAVHAPAHRPAAGALTATGPLTATDKGMPRFYVTLSSPGNVGHIVAQVHASLTGQVLSRVNVGRLGDGVGITADRSDRAFVIDATTGGTNAVVGLFLLRVSANGRSTKLTRLPLTLLQPKSQNVVDGIAVSPDGTRLAVALQVDKNANVLNPRGEIVVYSLTGGATQTWTAPRDVALPWDPAWTGGSRQLTFVWQDHLRGTIWFYTGSSQVRVLDTSAPGRNVLASSVIATGGGKLGFIQAALEGPGHSPIIAAVFQVPSGGTKGTAKVRLVALSATTGTIIKVFASRAIRYVGSLQEAKAVASCQVSGVDATGQHTLAYCPRFGRIDNGTFTLLPHNSGVFSAAW